MATIQGIYVALFGRPADPLGLAYFNEATNNGADLTAIGDLAATAEYQDRFDGMNNAQIVTAIYQSLFGRSPELAGLEFFVNALNNGDLSINNVAIAILDGAQGADADIVANKVAAADLFTAAIAADANALAAYQGTNGINAGVSFLSGITADEATVPSQAEVDAAVAALGEGRTTIGETYTLTDAVGENVVGTDANDIFEAVLADGTPATSTLNVGDRVDGAGGNDTLNLTVAAGVTGIPAGATIRNVETININATVAATLSAAAFVGAEAIWSDGSAGDLSLTNASLATTFGVRDSGQNLTVNITNATAGKDTANVVLDGTTGGNVNVQAATNDVENLNVNVVSDSSLAILTADDLETLTITGSGDLTVNSDLAVGLEEVNAGAATGDLVLNLGISTVDVSVVTGSGNDTIDASSQTGAALETTVDLGAGNDTFIAGSSIYTVFGGAGNDTINLTLAAAGSEVTGGAGADTIDLGGGAVVVNFTSASDSTFSAIDTYSNFTSGTDSIDLSALNLTGDTTGINAVTVGGLQNGGDYFDDFAVAEVTVGGTTYTVVDANNNGQFDVDGDLVILGLNSAVIGDFVF